MEAMATPAYVLDARDEWAGTVFGTVPWFLYAVLFASTSVIVGVTWDISWHRTIGRDTFWTPAHLAIYTGGIVAGLTCGWLALRLTFASGKVVEAERAATVCFWGFRAPLGAWVCIWGAFAMLTSAPFDDWWHNSYGLDVKILSPPHALLAAGIGAIQCGAMLMAVAWQNRSDAMRARLGHLYLISAGLLVVLIATLATEYLQRWDMHQSLFYMVSAGVFPFMLVSTARASISRWPATATALVYMGFMLVMLLVLPLFRAEPLLGPIYVHVTRFMPPDFPILLVVPALDLAMQRLGRGRDWRLSALNSGNEGSFPCAVALRALWWSSRSLRRSPPSSRTSARSRSPHRVRRRLSHTSCVAWPSFTASAGSRRSPSSSSRNRRSPISPWRTGARRFATTTP
jgi:hypothetical protein